MKRWELPVFSLAAVATWLVLGCIPIPRTLHIGPDGSEITETMSLFAAYLSPRVWSILIGIHILCSLVVGLLAWGLGFLTQACQPLLRR